MDVKINVHGDRLTESLRNYIEERIARLDRFNERVIDAKFELRLTKPRSVGEQWIAQFTIATPGRILRSEVREHDQHAAIDKSMDKMLRQIRRYHSKKIDRSKRGATNLGRLAAEQSGMFEQPESPGDEGIVVRTKRFEFLPMDPEEAVEQMELLEHDFFVFRNADSGQTNVVYRRTDGQYGLIEPDTG